MLQGKDGKQNACTVSLQKVDDASNPAEKWRARYRGIRLASAGTAPGAIKIESDETQELGKVDVDKTYPPAFPARRGQDADADAG